MTCGTFSANAKPGGVLLVQPVIVERAVERAVPCNSIEFGGVVGEKIARMHPGGIECAFPSRGSERGCARANFGFSLLRHDGRA